MILLSISPIAWAAAWFLFAVQSFRDQRPAFPPRLLCLTLICELMVLYPSHPLVSNFLYVIFVFYCLCSLTNLAAVALYGREEFLIGTKNPKWFWPQFLFLSVMVSGPIAYFFDPPYILDFANYGQFIVPIISAAFLVRGVPRPLPATIVAATVFRLLGGWIDTWVGMQNKVGGLWALFTGFFAVTVLLDLIYVGRAIRQKWIQASV